MPLMPHPLFVVPSQRMVDVSMMTIRSANNSVCIQRELHGSHVTTDSLEFNATVIGRPATGGLFGWSNSLPYSPSPFF
jgi:hypothetical protein